MVHTAYLQPHCSVAQTHMHTHARVLHIYWSVQKKKKNSEQWMGVDPQLQLLLEALALFSHLWLGCLWWQRKVNVVFWFSSNLERETEPLAQRAPVKTRRFSLEWKWSVEWILLGCKQMYVSNKQSPHLDIWKSLLKEKLFAFYYTIEGVGEGCGGDKSQFFQHYCQAFAHVKQTSDCVSYWPGNR